MSKITASTVRSIQFEREDIPKHIDIKENKSTVVFSVERAKRVRGKGKKIRGVLVGRSLQVTDQASGFEKRMIPYSKKDREKSNRGYIIGRYIVKGKNDLIRITKGLFPKDAVVKKGDPPEESKSKNPTPPKNTKTKKEEKPKNTKTKKNPKSKNIKTKKAEKTKNTKSKNNAKPKNIKTKKETKKNNTQKNMVPKKKDSPKNIELNTNDLPKHVSFKETNSTLAFFAERRMPVEGKGPKKKMIFGKDIIKVTDPIPGLEEKMIPISGISTGRNRMIGYYPIKSGKDLIRKAKKYFMKKYL